MRQQQEGRRRVEDSRPRREPSDRRVLVEALAFGLGVWVFVVALCYFTGSTG